MPNTTVLHLSVRSRPHALLFAGLAVLTGACSGDTSKPSPPSSNDGSTQAPPPPPPVRWRAAVGKAGAFAQTFDDVSWVTRSIAAQDLYAVTCVGNDDGWAVGAAGAVTHTLDGGRTWNWQDAHTTSALRAIRFGSATLGLLAGDSGMLAVTHDGGGTWETVPRATL